MTDLETYRVGEPARLETCAHCGGATVMQEHPALRYVCGACGGPRIPGIDAAALSAEIQAGLAEANSFARTRANLRALAIALYAMGALSFLALVAFTVPAALAFAVVLGVLGTSAWAAARTREAWCKVALDEAWARAAQGVLVDAGRSMTSEELAEKLRVRVQDADAILARASLDGARVSIGDDAELRYHADPGDVEAKELRK